MRSKLKHITLFFLTVFVISQMLQLFHAVNHIQDSYNVQFDYITENRIDSKEAKAHVKAQPSESAHHHHCLICSNFHNHFVDFKIEEHTNVFIPVFFDDITSNFYISFRVLVSTLFGSIELRGPPYLG